MAAQQGRQWGMTPPISTTLPTDKELALNDALIAELKSQNNFEAPEETEKVRYSCAVLAIQTYQFQDHRTSFYPENHCRIRQACGYGERPSSGNYQ